MEEIKELLDFNGVFFTSVLTGVGAWYLMFYFVGVYWVALVIALIEGGLMSFYLQRTLEQEIKPLRKTKSLKTKEGIDEYIKQFQWKK